MANLLSSYVLLFIWYTIRRDILPVYLAISSMGQWECGLTQWAGFKTLLISLSPEVWGLNMKCISKCQLYAKSTMIISCQVRGIDICHGLCECPVWEHLGGTSFNGTRGSQGPAHTQETSTDSPTACTSCQSAQWRLVLEETTNTLALLCWGSRLGAMFDIHIHNHTHAIKP